MVFPYLIDPQFTLRLLGRWANGGVLQVGFGTADSATIQLPRALWAVTAILIERAENPVTESEAGRFVTPDELAQLLGRRTQLGDFDPGYAIRFVFQLRQRLARSGAHQLACPADGNGSDWARRLIERQRFLGYRISLPPENLAAEILDADGPAGFPRGPRPA